MPRERSADFVRIPGTSRGNPQYYNSATGETKGKSYVENLVAKEAGFKSRSQVLALRSDPAFRQAVRTMAEGNKAKERELKSPQGKLLQGFRDLLFTKGNNPRRGDVPLAQRRWAANFIKEGGIYEEPALLEQIRRRAGSPGRAGRR